MGLIDVDAFIKRFHNGNSDTKAQKWMNSTVRRMIREQPVAYDVDKVVEQLEDYGNEEMCYYKNTPYEKCIEECINKAIEIVKGGGVDAKTDS